MNAHLNTPRTATTTVPSKALNPMAEPALKAWIDMGLQSFQFSSQRLQKCAETRKAMMACKSLEEFQKVQTAFYSTALEDYMAQAARMMGTISAPETGRAAGASSVKRGYDDVPL